MVEQGRKLPRLTAIPAARSSAPVLRVRLFLVLGALLAAALLGVISALAWFTQDPPVPVNLKDAQPRAAATATLVANAFLNGQAIPVQVTEDIQGWPVGVPFPHEEPQWNGFDTVTFPSGLKAERHRFLFYREVTVDNKRSLQMYELTVPIALSATGTPALAGLPYFAPTAYTDIVGNSLYETKEDVTVPPAVTAALNAWAQAWAAGDSATLKALAGDGTVNAVYPGLGGCQAGEVNALSAYPAGQNKWLFRARVPLVCANGFTTLMDLDVTTEGVPPDPTQVVGWGPVGSGVLGRESVRVLS